MKYRQKGKHIKYFVMKDIKSKGILCSNVEYVKIRYEYLSKVFDKLSKLQKIKDIICVYCYEYSNIKSVMTVVLTDLRITYEAYTKFVADMKQKYKYFKVYTIKEDYL